MARAATSISEKIFAIQRCPTAVIAAIMPFRIWEWGNPASRAARLSGRPFELAFQNPS
jgi:hypothetical protein